jgi:hypothetical protein
MTRLESKEGTNVTNQKKTALLAAALTVSLPSRTTATDTQKEAPPFGDVKPDDLVCVKRESSRKKWARRIAMQRLMSDKKNVLNMPT